jgi:hypothetical protein
MPVNTETFGDLVPYGDPSWYRNYNRRARVTQALHTRDAVTSHADAPSARCRGNSPYYSASHRAFRAKVRAFVDTEVTPHCDAWDRAKSIPRELFVKAFQAGLLPGVVGPPWPVAYAGPAPEVRAARRRALPERQLAARTRGARESSARAPVRVADTAPRPRLRARAVAPCRGFRRSLTRSTSSSSSMRSAAAAPAASCGAWWRDCRRGRTTLAR